MHGLSSHVHEEIFTLGLRGVTISYLEDNCTSFLLDVVKQVIRRVKYIKKEVDRLLLLGTIKYSERSGAAGDLCNILAMKLESVCVTTEGKSVVPSNPSGSISIESVTMSLIPTYMSLLKIMCGRAECFADRSRRSSSAICASLIITKVWPSTP